MNHPLIVITDVRPIEGDREPEIVIKALAASLCRSDCGFPIKLLRDEERPLFRIRRAVLAEVSVPSSDDHAAESDAANATRETVIRLTEWISAEDYPWIIVMDRAGLALRNIEHLIPEDSIGEFASPTVDFYWMPKAGSKTEATSGIWAVRGHLMRETLNRWSQFLREITDPELAWSQTVAALPFRKKRFESGEVIAPALKRVDWDAVSNAAFVTVPDWPPEQQRKFLQSLYFGTYFGDSTGLMLNILES